MYFTCYFKEQYSCWKSRSNNGYAGNVEYADDMDWHLFICSDCDIICHSLCLKSKNDGSVDSEESYLNLIPQLDEDERRNFLETYFSNERREYIESYLKINQNILIIRDYSAGSNATTMLCMNNGKNFFRKYAFGADGDKLYRRLSGCSV